MVTSYQGPGTDCLSSRGICFAAGTGDCTSVIRSLIAEISPHHHGKSRAPSTLATIVVAGHSAGGGDDQRLNRFFAGQRRQHPLARAGQHRLRALGTAVGNQKIDAAIALMVTIGRAMSEEDPITGGDGSPRRTALRCTAASERDRIHLYPV
jgi:hypothetical protein